MNKCSKWNRCRKSANSNSVMCMAVEIRTTSRTKKIVFQGIFRWFCLCHCIFAFNMIFSRLQRKKRIFQSNTVNSYETHSQCSSIYRRWKSSGYIDPLMKNHFNWLFPILPFLFFQYASHTQAQNETNEAIPLRAQYVPVNRSSSILWYYLSKINFLLRSSSFAAIYFQWLLLSLPYAKEKIVK